MEPPNPAAFESVPTHLKRLIGAFRQLPQFRGQAMATWPMPFRPFGVVVSEQSNEVFVLDFDNDAVYVFSPDGTLLRKWGSQGGEPGQFFGPAGIAVTKAGEVVVADFANHRVQVFRTDGTFLRMWGTEGSGEGQFHGPMSVVLVQEHEVIVTDHDGVQVFQLSNGAFVRRWSTKTGQRDYLVAACATPEGYVLVTDNVNNRVQMLTVEGVVVRQWGVMGSHLGQFVGMSGIVMRHHHVFVADWEIHRVLVFSRDGLCLCAYGSRGSGQGQFLYPSGVAVTRQGTLVVADRNNRRLQLWQ